MNILCLHGCCQNAQVFKNLLKNLEHKLKDTCVFHYLDAQHDFAYPGKKVGKTWFAEPLDLNEIGIKEYNEDYVKDTIKYVDDYIKNNDISVLIGFSQGGNVVATYLREEKSHIKCAVIFSGYSFVDSTLELTNIPILNVVSESDDIVPHIYKPIISHNTQEIYHEKGHTIPPKSYITQVADFIKSNI